MQPRTTKIILVTLLFFILLLIVSGLGAYPAKAADNTERVPLPGHVLSALTKARLLAQRSTAGEPLSLTVVLRRSDEAGFQRYLADVYNAKSPRFRQFLTPVEVSNRFGPSQADFNAVRGYFEELRS